MSRLLNCVVFPQVDVVCGQQLLDGYQSLKEVLNSTGASALQVSVQSNWWSSCPKEVALILESMRLACYPSGFKH